MQPHRPRRRRGHVRAQRVRPARAREHEPRHRPRHRAGELRDRQRGEGRLLRQGAEPDEPRARRQPRDHHRLPPGLRHADPGVDGRRRDGRARRAVSTHRPVPGRRRTEDTMATRTGWSPGPAAWTGRPEPDARGRVVTTTARRTCWRMPASAARRPRCRRWPTLGLERAVRSLVALRAHPEPEAAAVRRVGAVGSVARPTFPDSRPEATDRAATTARRWAWT